MKNLLLLLVLDGIVKIVARYSMGSYWFIVINSKNLLFCYILILIPLILFLINDKLKYWCLLFLVGIMSNTIERMLFGGVVDMIPIYSLSNYKSNVFINLADIYIIVSALVINFKLIKKL